MRVSPVGGEAGRPAPLRPGSTLALTLRQGRVELTMTCTALGEDLSVTLSGGDRAHIGAVAVSQPYPSHADASATSASTSVIALPGHKEEELARTLAARLASQLKVVVCVACGIHMDALQKAELNGILDMADDLVGQLLARLSLPAI